VHPSPDDIESLGAAVDFMNQFRPNFIKIKYRLV
jgi:hypothetical protein